MRHQQRWNLPLPHRREDELAHAFAQWHVEPGKRLVQQQGTGLRQQRAHQRNTGALPAGERSRVGVGKAVERQFRQSVCYRCLARSTRTGRQCEQQVFAHRHVGKQQIILKQQAHLALLGRQMVDAPALQQHAAVKHKGARQGAAHRRQQAGFARAAGAHHGVHAARRHRQAQSVDQVDPAERQLTHFQLQAHGCAPAKRRGRPHQPARPNTSAGSSHCSQA